MATEADDGRVEKLLTRAGALAANRRTLLDPDHGARLEEVMILIKPSCMVRVAAR
jgi:hypothetical protein